MRSRFQAPRVLRSRSFINRNLAMTLSVLAMPIFFAGCNIGGTGTDTDNGVKESENFSQIVDTQDKNASGSPSFNETVADAQFGIWAKVVDSNGIAVSGVSLTATQTDFRPDFAKIATGISLISTVKNQKEVISDSEGQANFQATNRGTFVIEGRKNGQSLFFDTLKITDIKANANLTYTVGQRQLFQGKVKLTSGMHIDSGKVFIRGTGHFAVIDSGGVYNLGDLPASVNRMGLGVRFVARPSVVLEVKTKLVLRDVAQVQPITHNTVSDSLELVYSCKELSQDSSANISNPVLGTRPTAMPLDSNRLLGTAQSKLDSARFNSALSSCDSVPGGALVNVKPIEKKEFNDPVYLKSTDKIILVTQEFVPVADTIPRSLGDLVTSVSYPQCVESPGQEKTSFDIALRPSSSGTGDLIVQDLPSACTKP